jgi:hypothetical protein
MFVIAKADHSRKRRILRLGDEPEDLALGRLLLSAESPGLNGAVRPNGGVPALGSAEMRWSDGGRPPLIRFPRKGVVPSATDLDGESAEWILRRAAVGEDRRWLLSLAGIKGRPSAGPPGPDLSAAALRDIRVLLASARRSAAHDLRYAFEVLAGSAEEVRTDRRLRAFREEVNRAVGVALKSRPVFGWRIAVIVYHSAEAVEDIVAARWRDRLANRVVLAANPGYEGGLVSYSFRSGKGVDASGIIASALPARSPAPRMSADGTAGRGMLQQDRFDELLTALKIRRSGNELKSR